MTKHGDGNDGTWMHKALIALNFITLGLILTLPTLPAYVGTEHCNLIAWPGICLGGHTIINWHLPRSTWIALFGSPLYSTPALLSSTPPPDGGRAPDLHVNQFVDEHQFTFPPSHPSLAQSARGAVAHNSQPETSDSSCS